jgi:preprotein translocase subunit SecB
MTDLPPNGAAGPDGAPPDDGAPGLRILAQFIRDLSFENPRAPESLSPGQQPHGDIGVEVGVRGRPDGLYDVELKLNVQANRDGEVIFHIELAYVGLFQLIGIPEAELEPVLMIEAPRFLFPFARRIVADLTTDGGFPATLLPAIDFNAVYAARRMAAEGPGGTA